MSTDNLPVIKRRVGRPKKIKEETNEPPLVKSKGRPSLGLTKEEKDIKYYESRHKWEKNNPVEAYTHTIQWTDGTTTGDTPRLTHPYQ